MKLAVRAAALAHIALALASGKATFEQLGGTYGITYDKFAPYQHRTLPMHDASDASTASAPSSAA